MRRLSPSLHMQNLYLISINVTNKLKEKFFHEYVPDVLDVSSIFQASQNYLLTSTFRVCKI